MRRTLVILDYRARWWREQGTSRTGCESVIESGLRGYAEKQANIRERLAFDFASMWLAGISDAKLAPPVTWPDKYSTAVPTSKNVKLRRDRNKLRARVVGYVEDSNNVPRPSLSSIDFE